MAKWTEQSVMAEIPGWIIEVKPGVVTLTGKEIQYLSDRGMNVEQAIELRDTLTEAIERASGGTPVRLIDSEPRVWSRRSGAEEPGDVSVVTDSDKDRWESSNGMWHYKNVHGEYLNYSWDTLLKGFGPLTEVK